MLIRQTVSGMVMLQHENPGGFERKQVRRFGPR